MKEEIDISVVELWEEFGYYNSEFKNQPLPEIMYFCDNKKDADECAQLVADGIKQATSTSLWWYETNEHPLPRTGNIYIITNWEGRATAIIKTSQVEKVPFNEIKEEYAQIEGEGDKSLEYWKKVHWDYYSREMKKMGQMPTEEMIIVCEHFKTIWTKNVISDKNKYQSRSRRL